jgi:hypothetical protein
VAGDGSRRCVMKYTGRLDTDVTADYIPLQGNYRSLGSICFFVSKSHLEILIDRMTLLAK